MHRQDGQDPGLQQGRLAAGNGADDEGYPIILPELRQRACLGIAAEKKILFGLQKRARPRIRPVRPRTGTTYTPHIDPIRNRSSYVVNHAGI
jgi:hypothetical protein